MRSHLARLLVDFVDGADLLTGTLELHFIDLADARERAVEVFHFLRVAGQTLALFAHLLNHFGEFIEFLDVVALCLGHSGQVFLLLSHPVATDNATTHGSGWFAFPTGSLFACADDSASDISTARTASDDNRATALHTAIGRCFGFVVIEIDVAGQFATFFGLVEGTVET